MYVHFNFSGIREEGANAAAALSNFLRLPNRKTDINFHLVESATSKGKV